jgi:hypothetical protein
MSEKPSTYLHIIRKSNHEDGRDLFWQPAIDILRLKAAMAMEMRMTIPVARNSTRDP